MEMHDHTDLTRRISMVAGPGTKPGRHCPGATTLAAYVDSTLGPSQRTDFEEHLADCSFCLGQVGSLVRDAEQELPAVPSHLLDAVQSRPASWSAWIPKPALTMLAVAATVILAVTVGLRFDWIPETQPTAGSTTPPAEERTVRNGATSASGPQILEPLEEATVSGAEISLRWRETSETLQYSVLLVSLQGDVVWEDRVVGSRALIPATDLIPGQRYFVWVEAHLRGGGSLKSAAVGFRVAAD